MFVNIIDILKNNVKTYGSKIALEDEKEILSWKELDEMSDIVGKNILNLGCKKGCKIGIFGRNSTRWAEFFLGILKMGGIPVLLNSNLKQYEIELIANRCDVENIFYDEQDKSICDITDISLKRTEFSSVLNDLNTGFDLKDIEINPFDTACIMFTSGSTSVPKAVMLSHENITENAKSIVKALHWDAGDRMCVSTPMFHCFGLTAGLLAGIISKCYIYVPEKFRSKKIFEAITSKDCNILSGVPSMFLVLYEKYKGQKFTNLKSGIIAGSPILPEDYKKITSMFPGMKLLTSYGQSETSPCVTVADWDTDIDEMAFHCGKVIENVSIKIDEDTAVDIGTLAPCGEILVKGVNVMKGYYNNPLENKKVFTKDGWLRTGDLGYLDDQENLHVKGRLKEIIIRAGENISPLEIEEVVYRIDGIKSAKIFGISSKIFQEDVVLCIVTDKEVSDKYILEYLSKYLAEYKLPKQIFRFDKFPMTSNGKIDVAALKKMIENMP